MRINKIFLFFLFQLTVFADDGVEVVKSVSPVEIEKREEDTDQVALETAEQEQHTHNFNHVVPPPQQIGQGQYFLISKLLGN